MLIVLMIDGSNDPVPLDIDPETDLEILSQLIQIQSNIPPSEQMLFHNGQPLRTGASLLQIGLTEGDIIIVNRTQSRGLTLNDIPQDITPEQFLSLVQEHPHLLEQLKRADPPLAEHLSSGNLQNLRLFMMKRFMNAHKRNWDHQQEMARIEADPESEENQQKIAEAIRLKNVQENMEMAVENMPESFVKVQMLYIHATINGSPLRAFVDSGAQSSIMSRDCAERCGLLRLMDTRYSGQARGVGTGRICGRIHLVQIQIGSCFFPMSLSVLETSDVDFLFGLDMLKRHRCIIDLGENCLRIDKGGEGGGTGGTGRWLGHESVPFIDDLALIQEERGVGEENHEGEGEKEGSGKKRENDSKEGPENDKK